MNASAAAARIGAPLALLVAAVGVRALAWREVLQPDGVVFFGNDAWYHARRIAYGVAHFPAQLGFDPYLAFPHGAKPIWSPGFDAILAGVARWFLSDPGEAALGALERWLVWVPPLLGAATIAAAMGVARRVFGRGEALWSGLLLCVLPAHFWYTRIGFLDHHAAVAWLSTLLVAGALSLYRADLRGPPRRCAARAAGCGLGVAALLWVWPGGMLHVLCIEAGLGWAMLAGRTRVEAQRACVAIAGMHAIAAVAMLPGWQAEWGSWSAWSPLVLSRFQPLWLGGVAGGAALCAGLWRWDRLGASEGRRVASGLAVGLALVALAGSAAPGLRDGVLDALRWLGRDEPFQRFVGESVPLFSEGGAFSATVAWRRFGPFVFLYPFAAIALAVSARRHPERWILFFWCAGLFAATLFQRRFFATSSVGFAIVAAACLCHAWRSASRAPGRAAWRSAVALAAAACAWPLLLPYRDFVTNEWRARRGEPLRAGPAFALARAGLDVAHWLRANTPETEGWLAADARPAYGVLAPWQLGHVIQYRGRRPTVVDNFGDDLGFERFGWARDVLTAPEPEAVRAMRERRVRYVVVERDAPWLEGAGAAGLHRALAERDGGALAHHRLRYESRDVSLRDPRAPALYKVFERVAGAEVVGSAAPGRAIEARLALRTSRGRDLVYAMRTRADARGEYRLRLPYANLGGPPGVEVAHRYELSCGDRAAGLVVPERAVRSGLRVEGPALCAAGSRVRPTRPMSPAGTEEGS